MNFVKSSSAGVAMGVVMIAAFAGLASSAMGQGAGPAPTPAAKPQIPTIQPQVIPTGADAKSLAAGQQVPTPTIPAGCGLTFDTMMHNFGKIDDTTPVSHSYKVKNTSDKRISFTSVKASCGCTVPKAPQFLEPGQEGTIDITFNPAGRNGRELKTVTIITDDPTCGTLTLHAESTVLKRVVVEPVAVWMGEIPFGNPGVQELSITGRAENFAIQQISLDNKNLKLEEIAKDQVELDGGTGIRYRYRVSAPATLPIGRFNGVVSVITNDSRSPSTSVVINGEVAGNIRLNPERFSVMMRGPAQPIRAEAQLQSRINQPIKILGVELVDVPAEMRAVVDVQPIAPGSRTGWRIVLSGTAPSDVAMIRGNVVVKTDQPNQTELRMPISGWMPPNLGAQTVQPVPGQPLPGGTVRPINPPKPGQ
ncbi:MAG: DUF1573 domain-containing protein [Planctomyces sp.]